MLTFKAKMTLKPEGLDIPDCQIAKIIELDKNEFKGFVAQPNDDRGFIMENRSLMYQRDGIYNCLLVLGKGSNDGVIVESEGFYYPKYTTVMPHARDFVDRELERDADNILRNITPDPDTGEISIYLGDIEEQTGAQSNKDSGITRMFYNAMQKHPAVAGVRFEGDCMVISPVASQEQTANGGLKLRDVLLLGDMENVYMVHESSDVGVPGSYISMMTDKGREDYAAILDAVVKEIRPGEYSPEVVLSGVSPELLMEFNQAALSHEQAEFMMAYAM